MPINVAACRAIPTRAVLGNFGALIPNTAGAHATHRVVTPVNSRVTLTPVLDPNSGVTSLGPAINGGGDTLFLPYAWDNIFSIVLPDPAAATLAGTTSFLTADMSGCKVFVDPITGGNGAVVVHHANNVTNPPPAGSPPDVETPGCTAFLDNLHNQARTYFQAAPYNFNLPIAGAASIDKPHYNQQARFEVQRKVGQNRNAVVFAGGTMVFGVVNGAKWDFYWETWGTADYNRPRYAPKTWVRGRHRAPQNFRVLGSGRFF